MSDLFVDMMRRFVLLLMLVPTLAFARDFDVRPAPSWAEMLPIDTNVSTPSRDVRGGIYAILIDHQIHEGKRAFFREVKKVLTSSAVQNASEISIDFDPSFEKLVVHDIAIIRGAQHIHALNADEIRVIEKEPEADDRIYDGMRTAIAFVDGVRAGDVIDASWSIDGSNPLLDGKYADTYDLTSDVPARLIRHRLIWPSSRTLHHRSTIRGLDPRIESRNGSTIFTWERRDVAALDVEDDTPDWFDPYDQIEVSELASWSEVAKWADELFQMNDASRRAVKELAAKFRNDNKTRDSQLLAAIRFVQDDIRYLGIEMGRNSHEPHQPANVLEQRWGDCKDKSFLLAALLRELGVEAVPALVNTRMRRALDHALPSPFLFDHVIDQAIVDGKTYWIDPTLSDQGGTLGTIDTPNDERALIVRADAASLARIVTTSSSATRVERTYTAKSWDAPVSLVVRTTYIGADADAMRADLASSSIAGIAKEELNALAADQPKIAADGALDVRDDRTRNVIVMTARYVLRDAWKDGEWPVYPNTIEAQLTRPETSVRSMPLAFSFPMNVTESMTFHLPPGANVRVRDTVVDDAAFRYEAHVARSGDTINIRHTLRAKRDAVEAARVAEHLTNLNEVRDHAGTTLTRESEHALASALGGFGWYAAALVLIVALAARARRRAANVTPA